GVSAGILSLAERPDSILMWSHYACDHSGFVIGFDVDYPEWNRVGPEDDDDRSGVLRKVRYSKVRPNWGTLDVDRMGMFFTKSCEWEYEQEWRIFRGVEEADYVIEGAQDVCLYNFPKTSVRRVILGERSSGDMQSEIIRLLNADPAYASVEVLRVRIDKLGFSLNLESISRT